MEKSSVSVALNKLVIPGFHRPKLFLLLKNIQVVQSEVFFKSNKKIIRTRG